MKCNECRLFGKCREIRAASKEHFKWSMHNLFWHPLSELIHLFGFTDTSNRLHEWSIPDHEPNTGRG